MGVPHGYAAQPQGDDLLRAMVHCAHDAIFAVDRDLTVLTWNPAAETLFGYPTADIVGRNIDLLIPPERRADQREMLELIDAGARMERFRALRRHRDGHLVPVMVTMSPLRDPSNALVGLTVIARAVSDRERLESSLQSLLEAAPDAFVGVADDGRIVLSNGQAENLFGLARHGLIGKPIDKLLVPPLPANAVEPRAVDASGDSDDGERAEGDGDLRKSASVAHRADGSTVPV
jgi:PAS domain S-box-containing protein